MLHEEIPPCAERKGRDCGLGAEEAFVVAVVRYAVVARGVVVYEAEVKCAPGGGFGAAAEGVEAGGQGTRAVFVLRNRNWGVGDAVEDGKWWSGREDGGGVEAEDGGVAGSGYGSFEGTALNLVGYAVEEERGAEEVEELPLDVCGDEGCVIEKVQIGLIVDGASFAGGAESECFEERWRQLSDWEGVGWMGRWRPSGHFRSRGYFLVGRIWDGAVCNGYGWLFGLNRIEEAVKCAFLRHSCWLYQIVLVCHTTSSQRCMIWLSSTFSFTIHVLDV